jgi:hypothetical protein
MTDAADLVSMVSRPATVRSAMPFGYRAYGLSIRSDLLLSELDPYEAGTADLTIRVRPTGRPLPDPSIGSSFEFDRNTRYLAWSAVGGFLVNGNNAIDIEPANGAGDELLHLPLLGPVMALLLHLRGMLVLHASAIAIGERSAIFLGDKLAGKSTTAAALVAAGHRLLADDVVAIDFGRPGGPQVVPGFPQLKLDRRDGHSVIGDSAEAFPLVLPEFEKRQHRLTEDFSHVAVPPTHIYVLARGSVAMASALPVAEALKALMRFSYVTRFRANLLSGHSAASHLRQCAAVAGVVRASRLEVPAGLDRLSEVVRLVEADLA